MQEKEFFQLDDKTRQVVNPITRLRLLLIDFLFFFLFLKCRDDEDFFQRQINVRPSNWQRLKSASRFWGDF